LGIFVAIVCLFVLKTGGCQEQDFRASKAVPSNLRKIVKTPSWVTSWDQKPDSKPVDLIPSQTNNEDPVCELVPLEWEEPLFKILLDQKEGSNNRCLKLIEMATATAKNVPSVQRECLKHLIYSLQDTDTELFLLVSTNPAIPLQMRVEFFQEVLGIRPDELCESLCSRLAVTKEAPLAGYAISYLNDRKAEKAKAVGAENY
jgi:hypothetical protein